MLKRQKGSAKGNERGSSPQRHYVSETKRLIVQEPGGLNALARPLQPRRSGRGRAAKRGDEVWSVSSICDETNSSRYNGNDERDV